MYFTLYMYIMIPYVAQIFMTFNKFNLINPMYVYLYTIYEEYEKYNRQIPLIYNLVLSSDNFNIINFLQRAFIQRRNSLDI